MKGAIFLQRYNIIIVYDKDKKNILMCKRKKKPYLGLYNFVGGKAEENETAEDAAYRELFEETGITRDDIKLAHLMDFVYYLSKCSVEVFAGGLNKDFEVFGDENDLLWMDLDHNFFDMNEFAGEGNIGHMLEQVKIRWNDIFKNE